MTAQAVYHWPDDGVGSVLLQRIREDLSWRWQLAHRKRFLRYQFQNGEELIESYLDQQPCETAVCLDSGYMPVSL